jgi:hypothetical protein
VPALLLAVVLGFPAALPELRRVGHRRELLAGGEPLPFQPGVD